MNRRKTTGLGLALAGLGSVAAAVAGVRRTGSAVKETSLDSLDALLEPPAEVVHHTVSRPDGAQIHVVEVPQRSSTPDRATVLLCHGVTNQWTTWSPVMRLLPDECRILAWDMRGHGESTRGNGVSIAAAGADLAAVLNEFDVSGGVVVGHSMGGMVLGRFAVDWPAVRQARVSGLVFLSTTGSSTGGTLRSGGTVRAAQLLRPLARERLVGSYSWPPGNLSTTLLRTGFGVKVSAQMIEVLRELQASMNPTALVEATHSIADHQVLDRLAVVRTPSRIVVGSLDRLTPPLHSRALHEALSGSSLTVLDEIGHNVMLEQPSAVVEAIASLR